MPLNILLLSHKFHPDIGGIETCSIMLAEAFTNAGHTVRLMTWSVDRANTIFPYEVIRRPRLVTLLKEHYWADVIFENNPCFRLSWPKFIFRRKSIVVLQTWLADEKGNIRWLDKLKSLLLADNSQVVAISEAIRKQCWPKAVVINNPYQEDLFKVDNLIDRNKDFVFLGRLVSDKGATLAIRAIYEINTLIDSSNYSFGKQCLTIIGDGPERELLENLVQQFNLKSQITFKGSLQGRELVKILNQHKFLLVPSTWEEPFGIVALEGMGCGCVPIVSNGGGLPDAVGDAGFIFQRDDISSLVSAMTQLQQQHELCDLFRQKAAMHLSNYSTQFIAKKYLTILDTI